MDTETSMESYIEQAKKCLLLPSFNLRSLASKAKKAVKRVIDRFPYRTFMDSLGLGESHDKVVIEEADLPMYIAGQTEIDGHSPIRIRINRYVSRLKNTFKNFYERVVDHEVAHALTSRLSQYADVPRRLYISLMETLAEYGLLVTYLKEGRKEKAMEIIETTPYPVQLELGYAIDHFYPNGIKGFVGDVIGYRSMRKAYERFMEGLMKKRHAMAY
jgi:hypothetical protein